MKETKIVSPGRTDDIQTTVDILRKRYDIDDNIQSYLIESNDASYVFDKLNFITEKECCGILGEIDSKLSVERSVGVIRHETGTLVCIRAPYDDSSEYYLFTNALEEALKEFYYSKKTDTVENPIDYGTYEVKSSVMGGATLMPVNLGDAIEPVLNDNIFKEISEEISNFHKKENVYKENDITYKRGMLLYGPPGTGKTSLIKHFLKTVDKSINILCDCKDVSHIVYVKKLLASSSFENVKKIVVFEDIDGIDSYNRSHILNLLDGIEKTHNVVFIATTNYPQNLDSGFKNRPSRFDTFYKIDYPNNTTRRNLISLYLGKMDDKEADEIVKMTENFTGAYFKEIFILSKLRDLSYMEAVKFIIKKTKDFNEFKDVSYVG